MESRDEFENRIKYYRDCLDRLPRYGEALDLTLMEYDSLDDTDRVFLHVYAPVITMYAGWILEKAEMDGRERIYFLGRDGRPIYLAALKLKEKLNSNIDIRYLKISRYALRTAEYALSDTDIPSSVCKGGIDVTFNKIMKRANLTDEETSDISDKAGFINREDRQLSNFEIRRLRKKLKNIPEFSEYVRSHCDEQYRSITVYFRQEGLYDNVDYCIADSGWLGTVQESLNRLLSHEDKNRKTVKGYYFGLYDLPKSAHVSDYKSFYLRPWRDVRRKIYFSICLFETVCTATDGMTVGYKEREERYIPIENEHGNPNRDMILRNEELLQKYLDKYSLSENVSLKEMMNVTGKLLSQHMGNPTIMETELFGRLKFCDDVVENVLQDVAAKWVKSDIDNNMFLKKLLIKTGIVKTNVRESGWPEGSIVNAGISVKSALFNERLYKKLMYIRKVAGLRDK